MTARVDLDQLVTEWLESVAPHRTPERVLETVMAEVATERQERHVTQRLFGDRLGRSTELRWALVVLALLAGLAAAIAVGSSLLRSNPPPSLTGWIVVAADARAGSDLMGSAPEAHRLHVRDIYLVRAGEAPTRIIGGDTLDQACPALSPDGRVLAYLEADVPRDGGSGNAARPSSDHWTLVFVDLDGDGDPIGATERRIPLDVTVPVEAPCFTWSRDGSSLGHARAAWDGGTGGIEIASVGDATTRFMRLERSTASATTFAWSPDAAELVVYAAGGGMGLLMVTPNHGAFAAFGRALRRPSAMPASIDWSADGLRVAFDWTQVGETKPRTSIADALAEFGPVVELDGAAPAWSPDGTRLAVLRAVTSQIVVVDPDGSNEVHLQLPVGPAVSRLVWSPDGSQILYFGAGEGGTALIAVPVDPRSRAMFLISPTWALSAATAGDVSWEDPSK